MGAESFKTSPSFLESESDEAGRSNHGYCIFIDLHHNKLYVKKIVRFKVQGSRFKVQGSRLHSLPRTAFGMCIYKKGVIFFRPNAKFGAKLAITWENEHF
ncbi:MAG: hypothetical protein JRJ86_21795 [Deltaproteobacteria bacterium]|nr:hypothetical protein [Deltaproteobacteria bacterium]